MSWGNDSQDFLNLREVQTENSQTLQVYRYGDMWPLGSVPLVPELILNVISIKMLGIHNFSVAFIDDVAKGPHLTIYNCSK